MDEQLDIVVDLVAALSIAFAGGWVFARFRLSPIFGYVLAGMIISPFTPGFVGDADRLRFLGDIGVVLLLFGIGVQFSIRDLLRAGRSTGALAIGQIAVTFGIGYGAGLAFGWDSLEAAFFGAAVSLSSSTVMSKVVAERSEERSQHARIAITWSLVQDLSTILFVVLLGVAAESDAEPGQLALEAIKIVGFLVGVLVIGVRVVPWALEQVLAVRSREVFVLAIATFALGTAASAAAVGISLALGAFLAGLVVSESDRAHQVLDEVLPLRDLFAVLFFVVIGMLIDPAEIGRGFHIFAAALAIIVLVKLLLVAPPLALTGVPRRSALLAGVLLAQSAEFTFLLLDAGVADNAVSQRTFSLTVSAVGVSVLLTPLLTSIASRLTGDEQEDEAA